MKAGLCKCGCGRPAPLATATDRRKGYVKGEPISFINGHQNVGRHNTPTLIQLGERFGRWTALAEAGVDHRQSRLYLCRCDCGTEREVVASNLRRGASTSCGCLQKETNRERSMSGARERMQRVTSEKT